MAVDRVEHGAFPRDPIEPEIPQLSVLVTLLFLQFEKPMLLRNGVERLEILLKSLPSEWLHCDAVGVTECVVGLCRSSHASAIASSSLAPAVIVANMIGLKNEPNVSLLDALHLKGSPSP
jgi:hypothetical protein